MVRAHRAHAAGLGGNLTLTLALTLTHRAHAAGLGALFHDGEIQGRCRGDAGEIQGRYGRTVHTPQVLGHSFMTARGLRSHSPLSCQMAHLVGGRVRVRVR